MNGRGVYGNGSRNTLIKHSKIINGAYDVLLPLLPTPANSKYPEQAMDI